VNIIEANYDARVIRSRRGCWGWRGSTNPQGYGRVGKQQYAHRVAWEFYNGPIPDGLFVLHRCDNPPCTNPAHLFLGTHEDNMADAAAKGRLNGRPKRPAGERNPTSKLTAAKAREIREMCAAGVGQREVASRFGVHQQTVWSIVNRRTWRSA